MDQDKITIVGAVVVVTAFAVVKQLNRIGENTTNRTVLEESPPTVSSALSKG